MKHIPPSADLYNRVRGGFVAQGTSLSKVCESVGVKRQAARLALLGGWTGPRASEVVQKLTEKAGISLGSDNAG